MATSVLVNSKRSRDRGCTPCVETERVDKRNQETSIYSFNTSPPGAVGLSYLCETTISLSLA
jgi:hypothetical protein